MKAKEKKRNEQEEKQRQQEEKKNEMKQKAGSLSVKDERKISNINRLNKSVSCNFSSFSETLSLVLDNVKIGLIKN